MKGFNSLELFFKMNFIVKNGIPVLSKRNDTYVVKLFSWDRFFFELYYRKDTKRITRVSMADELDMVKYLDDISIADLGVATRL